MVFRTLTAWYLRNERWISLLALVGGFIFDSLTLRRVDLILENLYAGGLLAVAAIGIILINLLENQKKHLSQKAYRILHFWLIIFVQFSFGGLFSTFLVFYFRSATLSVSWPFLLVLGTVFILNEILKHHYTRLIFQVSVLYLSIYSFAIFLVPVVTHKIGPKTFVLSGFVSLTVLMFFLSCLRVIARENFQKSKRLLLVVIIGITTLVNVLYFTNLIPPIPLSLKEGGIYHSIVRASNGVYTATGEKTSFWRFLGTYEKVRLIPGQSVYAFSSIFAPTGLSTQVIHAWQHYDEATKEWKTLNETKLSIVGGRDGGFRTYSIKTITSSGLWRVDVKTPQGQIIGRIKFEIENVESTPELITTVLH